MGAQAGDTVVDIVDGEHDAMQAQRVGRRVLRLGAHRRGGVVLRVPGDGRREGHPSPGSIALRPPVDGSQDGQCQAGVDSLGDVHCVKRPGSSLIYG